MSTIVLDKPLKVNILGKYLYNLDPTEKNYKGSIVSITAYKGQYLTFDVLIENEYLFSALPLEALYLKELSKNTYNYNTNYCKCPDGKIDIFQYNHKLIQVYLDHYSEFVSARYILTINFYEDNEQLHFVLLDTNQYALLPNQKINWANNQRFEKFKKANY